MVRPEYAVLAEASEEEASLEIGKDDEIEESSQRLPELQARHTTRGRQTRPSDEDDDSGIGYATTQQRRARGQYTRWMKACAAVVALLLAQYGVYDLGVKLYGKWSPTKYDRFACDCGSSIEEARSMGCQYVPVAAAWLPPRCRDRELEEEFDRAGPGPNGEWEYYANPNGTKTYSHEEMANLGGRGGDFLVFTTKAWHIMHCVHYWRKQIRLAHTGATMEPRYAGEGHAKHCLMDFLNVDPAEDKTRIQQISLTSHGSE